MYEQAISRANPGCVVFLIDRSESMWRAWPGLGCTIAEAAVRAVNQALLELCIRSTAQADAPMRLFFYVGIFGYGLRPRAGGEGVESALPEPLADGGIVPLPQLAGHQLSVAESGPPSPRMPVWVEAAAGYGTPTCAALSVVRSHVSEWVAGFPNSFPPIVVHITDGLPTDSPFGGADLITWATRLTEAGTADGDTLLVNVFLSPGTSTVDGFPTTAAELPKPATALFAVSSRIPESLARSARSRGLHVESQSRALMFALDLSWLLHILPIGTGFRR